MTSSKKALKDLKKEKKKIKKEEKKNAKKELQRQQGENIFHKSGFEQIENICSALKLNQDSFKQGEYENKSCSEKDILYKAIGTMEMSETKDSLHNRGFILCHKLICAE